VRARLRELGRADAARDADGAWISTVHGLCARLLRAHAVAAGLDPRFVVLDEPLARELRAAAWADAFAAWLAGRGDAALDLAGAYGADRLQAAVTEAHDALRSAGHAEPRLPVPAAGPAPDAARLRRAAAAAADALAAAGEGKTVVRARTAVGRCDDVLAGLAPGVLPAAAALAAASFRPGNARALAGPECAAYRAEHERFAQACTQRRAVAAAAELDDLLARYAGTYAEAKRARGGLDFDDLELRARDLLAGAPAVRAAYRERFQRILVDEFQDSNPLQVELFGLLGDGNVVTVGDEQQAIYGFRHADVEVFRRRRAVLEPEGRALALTRNFRSRPEVVDVVNAVFGPRLGAAHTPLVAARPAAGEPRVELLLTGTQGWDAVALGDLPRAAPWRHAEARLLAQRIADLVAAGEARAEDVVGPRPGDGRPAGLRAGARGRRAADAHRRRARLVGPPGRPRPVRLARRPGQPARRARPPRRARLPARRPVDRRARPGRRGRHGQRVAGDRAGVRRRGVAGEPGPRRAARVRRGRAPDRGRGGAARPASPPAIASGSPRSGRGSPPSGRSRPGSGSTSCCGGRSRRATTTCTCCACPAARGGWPTCTSSCGWPPSTSGRTAATSAGWPTARRPSSRPTRGRPTRRSSSATRRRSGS
jgi:hypothetical protein